MKKIYFISLILILLVPSELFSQGWEKVYSDIYSHDNSHWGAGIQKSQITSDGGIILIGYGPNAAQTHNQAYLIKTNSTGDIIWSKTFPDSMEILPESVIETNDGYLMGGIRYNPTCSFLLKVDLTGNILWSKKYDGAQCIDMIQKTTNGFILLGSNGYNGSSGIYCSKINSNGIVSWTKTLNTTELYPKGIAPAENNGFIIIGEKHSYTYGRGDECYIMKFDSTGNMLWGNSYGYANSFAPNTIKLTNTGDYIIGGSILMKIDKGGNLLWVKEWYGTFIYDIEQTADNDFIIAAGGYWNIDGIFLYKVSADGTPEWEKAFGRAYDQVTNIFITQDHGFLISGNHQSQNIRGFYLIKTDSTGQSGCNTHEVSLMPSRLNTSLCIINSVAFSPSGNPLSSNLMLTCHSAAVNTVNLCCFAKAEITAYSEYLCNGDSIHYFGSGAPHLQWYNGDTTSSIVTLDTIVYLTATNTCGSSKDTLIVSHLGFVPSFTYVINKDTICRGDSILLNITGNAPSYYCSGKYVKTINSTTYVLKPTGTSNYTVIATTGDHGYPGCTNRQTFTIYVRPDQPTITKIAETLFSSSAINNQWFLNGTIISGATSQSLIITAAGSYSVKVTGAGCSNVSDEFSYAPDSLIYSRNAWQKMIGSNENGSGTCVIEANDGGFVIGSNYYSATTRDDITLIKTDRNGEVLWSKKYGGPGEDHIYSIIKVNSGYIGVGSTTSFGNGNMDVYILSFDENGELLWSKTYGDWNNQQGNSIEQTSDGGFIVTGYSTNPNAYYINSGGWLQDNNDLYLLKTDSNGNLLWSKVFDTSNDERGVEVHETYDGKYIVAGTSKDLQSKERVYVVKTDHNGDLIWSKTIANSFFAETASMKITSDNNYLICTGASSSAYLLKLNENGNVLWSKIAHVNSWGGSLIISNDNSAVFTAGFGYLTGALSKIDMNGNLIWSRNYSSAQQYISKTIQLSDGSFIMTGGIDTSGHYQPGQISLINTDANGETNCSQPFYPTITDETYTYFTHTTVTSSLGTEKNASTHSYIRLFQSTTLCQSASLLTDVKEISKDVKLKVYPNPTGGIINVEFSDIKGISNLSVFDIMGRCVYNQHVTNSFYQIDLSGKGKGIYFLEMTTDKGREVRKIVLE